MHKQIAVSQWVTKGAQCRKHGLGMEKQRFPSTNPIAIQDSPWLVWCARQHELKWRRSRHYNGKFVVERKTKCHFWSKKVPSTEPAPLLFQWADRGWFKAHVFIKTDRKKKWEGEHARTHVSSHSCHSLTWRQPESKAQSILSKCYCSILRANAITAQHCTKMVLFVLGHNLQACLRLFSLSLTSVSIKQHLAIYLPIYLWQIPCQCKRGAFTV